jgi:outer membrane immunogenic protein
MKRILSAVAFAVAGMVPAFAADLPPAAAPPPRAPATYVPTTAPLYNWGGFYIGLNGGYGFGGVDETNNSTTTNGALFGAPGAFPPGTTFTGPDRTFDLNGGFGGGQIGFNYQWSALVFGLEADFQYGSIKGTDSFTTGGVQYGTTGKIDWFGTVRGRVGYAMDRFMPYVTGGLAYDHTQTDLSVQYLGPPAAPTYWSSLSGTTFGYTVGGGLEVGLAQNWTVKIEYLYMAFPQTGYNFAFAGTEGSTVHSDATTHVNLVRAGFNFKYP